MSQKDMFLKLESKRGGAVKGESEDPVHPAEMVVLGFSWGMTSTVSTGFAGKETKPAQLELRIVKRVDSASTGLMSIMKTNDEIKKAVLTVRKAGGKQEDYSPSPSRAAASRRWKSAPRTTAPCCRNACH